MLTDKTSQEVRNDISKIVDYMMIHCCGYRNAQPRYVIREALGMNDVYFRDLCAEIPEIITSSKIGYYALPLVDVSGEETKFALEIINGEDRRRMIALYLRQRQRRKAIQKMNQNNVPSDLFVNSCKQ